MSQNTTTITLNSEMDLTLTITHSEYVGKHDNYAIIHGAQLSQDSDMFGVLPVTLDLSSHQAKQKIINLLVANTYYEHAFFDVESAEAFNQAVIAENAEQAEWELVA